MIIGSKINPIPPDDAASEPIESDIHSLVNGTHSKKPGSAISDFGVDAAGDKVNNHVTITNNTSGSLSREYQAQTKAQENHHPALSRRGIVGLRSDVPTGESAIISLQTAPVAIQRRLNLARRSADFSGAGKDA
jgi:hypothetical protein